MASCGGRTAERFGRASPRRCRSFETRRDDSWPAKAAIGEAAAALVEDHDTILLDGGSTTYELARHLVGRPLQVVTNSLPVAHLLSSSESIDLVMIGGCVRGRTAVAIGPMADSMLHSINVGKAFLVSRGDHRSRLLQQQHDVGREREGDAGFGRSSDRGCRQQQVRKSQS